MPKIRLTKTTIDRLEHPEKGQIDYYDEATLGLVLRVGTRSKTFLVRASFKDPATQRSKTISKKLGRFGDLTLQEARRRVEGYDDPEKGFVPGERLRLARQATAPAGHGVDLRRMLEQFLREKRTLSGRERKTSTIQDYRARIEQHFADWLYLTLPEIASLQPQVLIDRHNLIAESHGPYAGRNAFVVLSAVLNYAVVKFPRALPTNPVAFLTRRDAGIIAPIKSREDHICTLEEFTQFAQGLEAFNPPTRDCLLFALFQGLRSSEAAGLRWEHTNLEMAVLRIPNTKNRRDLHIPLCSQSLEILRRRRVNNPETSPWVFPSGFRLNKTGHVRLTSARLREKTGLSLTVHGLRRTFITAGVKLGLKDEAGRLTNHIDSSVVGRFYDGSGIEDLREPLQKIADRLENQLTGQPV